MFIVTRSHFCAESILCEPDAFASFRTSFMFVTLSYYHCQNNIRCSFDTALSFTGFVLSTSLSCEDALKHTGHPHFIATRFFHTSEKKWLKRKYFFDFKCFGFKNEFLFPHITCLIHTPAYHSKTDFSWIYIDFIHLIFFLMSLKFWAGLWHGPIQSMGR